WSVTGVQTCALPISFRVARRDVAEEEIAVPGQPLGVGREGEIGAEIERPLAEDRRGRVVDDDERALGVRRIGERPDVADVEPRVDRKSGGEGKSVDE